MRYVWSIALLLFVGSISLAQDDHAADRAVLRDLKDIYEKAVSSGNADALIPFIAADFTGVVPTNEQVVGVDGLKDYWKRIQDLLGPGGKVATRVTFEPSLIAGDFAISHGTTDNTATTSSGSTYAYTTNWTALSRKSGSDWKLVRIHDSMNPIENEFAASFSKARAIKAAVITGIATLILGVIIGRLSKRRARA